jgi:hypothetical protein
VVFAVPPIAGAILPSPQAGLQVPQAGLQVPVPAQILAICSEAQSEFLPSALASPVPLEAVLPQPEVPYLASSSSPGTPQQIIPSAADKCSNKRLERVLWDDACMDCRTHFSRVLGM